jgi:hypothetical protein
MRQYHAYDQTGQPLGPRAEPPSRDLSDMVRGLVIVGVVVVSTIGFIVGNAPGLLVGAGLWFGVLFGVEFILVRVAGPRKGLRGSLVGVWTIVGLTLLPYWVINLVSGGALDDVSTLGSPWSTFGLYCAIVWAICAVVIGMIVGIVLAKTEAQ